MSFQLIRYEHNPILKKNPQNTWEAGSVLNPCVFYDNGMFRMVYRATNDTKMHVSGGYVSSIGYAESTDGIHFTRHPKPLIIPDQPYEMGLGCEDPRVTKIDGQYVMFYTAVKGYGKNKKVRIALATSLDFKTFIKHGVVGPDVQSKAAILFPEKINGQYVMFYTAWSDSPKSSIMQATFDTFEEILSPPKGYMMTNLNNYEKNVVFKPPQKVYRGAEVGAVPIKTKSGWVCIYCPSNMTHHPEWTIGAALLDLHHPQHILSVSDKSILRPETHSEKTGIVNNVTFPEGAVVIGDDLYVYYGSGDQGCCLARCSFNSLETYLKSLR